MRILTALVLCTFALACSSATDDVGPDAGATSTPDAGAPADTTPPTVTSTMPPDGAVDVAPNAEISAVFSEPLDAASVTASTFTLKQDGTPVPGSVLVKDATVTFSPAARLAHDKAYTATLTTGVKDAAGNALAAEKSWTFTIRSAAWTAPTPVGPPPEAAETLDQKISMAVDGAGVVHALWVVRNDDTDQRTLRVARYEAGIGWTAQTLVSKDQNIADAHVAVNAAGTAFALWRIGGDTDEIWAARYTKASGWSEPASVVATPASNSYDPRVVVDAQGNATVMFATQSPNGQQNDVSWVRYIEGQGWGTAALLEQDAGRATPGGIAVAGTGEVFAAYTRWEPGTGITNLEARVFAAGQWSEQKRVTNGALNAETPDVAADANGNAVLAWTYTSEEGPTPMVFQSRWTAATPGWSEPARLDGGTRTAREPRVRFDAAGNAMAIWREFEGSAASLYSAKFVANAWTAAELAEHATASVGADFAFDLSPAGEAFAMWMGPEGLVWNRQAPGAAWGTEEAIPKPEDIQWLRPTIVVDAGGVATAMWLQTVYDPEEATGVMAARFE